MVPEWIYENAAFYALLPVALGIGLSSRIAWDFQAVELDNDLFEMYRKLPVFPSPSRYLPENGSIHFFFSAASSLSSNFATKVCIR